MADMRDYKEQIKMAVARERKEDENWSWRVASITKDTAKIGWSYLDYIGEKSLFTVEIDDTDVITAVTCTLPTGDKVYCLVGPNRWDDCKTIEEAIGIAIHSMAVNARSIY